MRAKLMGVGVVAIAALAACADSPVAPTVRAVEVTQDVAAAATSEIAGSIAPQAIRYLCRNTFEVSNSWRVPAALYWRAEGTSARGHVEVPAGGVAAFDATVASEGRTVLLYADAAHTVLVGKARHTRRACVEITSGDAFRSLAVAATCGSTITVTNTGSRGARVSWVDPVAAREGVMSVPARGASAAQATLSFDVAGASTVRIRFGTSVVGTVSLPSPTPCREGAVLSWTLLGAATTTGGAAVHSVLAEQANAIFTSDGPDYGAGRVWRIDLSTNQSTELASSNYPSGKFRQLLHDPVRGTLVTYWDGLGQAYEMPETGGAWTPVGSSGSSDEYYEAAAFWNPVSSSVNVWGGYGFGSWKNALWSLDATNGAWTVLPATGALPWGRGQASSAVDATGRRLFITGGEGSSSGQQFAPDQQFLSDLWSLDLASMQWTNIIPVGQGTAAKLGPIAYVQGEDALYRFGGVVNGAMTNQLHRVTLSSSTPAFVPVSVYGTLPSPRYSFGLHYDAARHRLVLVSGYNGANYLNDLWELRLP